MGDAQGPLYRLGTVMFGDFPGTSGKKQIRDVIQAEGSNLVNSAMDRTRASLSTAKRVMNTVLHIDEDKEHDRRLAGVQIDPQVMSTKERMRFLRNELGEAIALYEHFNKSEPAFSLPDLSGWCRHESFCGEEATAAAIHHDLEHMAGATELLLVLRNDLSSSAVAQLKLAQRGVAAGLEALYQHEVRMRDAAKAHTAAQTRLSRANGAAAAAREEQRKATAAAAKAAAAAATAAMAAAQAAMEEAKDAVPRHLSRRPRRRARAHAAAPLTPPLLPRARPAPLSRHTL